MQRTFERIVPHSADQMLALVADVETYPDFIPHCQKMEVVRSANAPETRFSARMHVRFGPISQAYTSAITVDPEAKTLSARVNDGPFSYLSSLWHFLPRGQGQGQGEGCHIRFEIDFKIANPLIRSVAEPAFAAKQEEVIDAFVAEAQKRFG